jgi:hypothetical protein
MIFEAFLALFVIVRGRMMSRGAQLRPTFLQL